MKSRLVPAAGVGFIAACLFISVAMWMAVPADIRGGAGFAPFVIGTSLVAVLVLSWIVLPASAVIGYGSPLLTRGHTPLAGACRSAAFGFAIAFMATGVALGLVGISSWSVARAAGVSAYVAAWTFPFAYRDALLDARGRGPIDGPVWTRRRLLVLAGALALIAVAIAALFQSYRPTLEFTGFGSR